MARGPLIIFSYAPDIFTQLNKPLPRSLIEHEGVHLQRQRAMGVKAWWDWYLTDPQFRWDEELLAHRKEYQVLASEARTFKQRQAALKIVAKKLAAPLYGRMVSTEQAMQLLTQGE